MIKRIITFNCIYLFLTGLLVLSSCRNDDSSNPVENEIENSTGSLSKKQIEELEYTDFGASPQTRNAVENWNEYQELVTEVDNLKNGDLAFLEEDPEVLTTFFSDLRSNLPQTLNTSPINARLLALETHILKGNELFRMNGVTAEQKLKTLKDIFVSMSDLNDQMNTKFEIEQNNNLRLE